MNRRLRGLIRWTLRLVVALAVLVALAIGLLYAWALPRLDQWRPQLVDYLQSQTGLDIQIDALHASLSPHWLPVLEIQHATIASPQAPWQATLARAQVGLSWQLLRGEWFGDVLLEQAHFEWRGQPRTPDAPTPAHSPDTAPSNAPAPDRAAAVQALQWLLKQPSIRIVNSSLAWSSAPSSQAPIEPTDAADATSAPPDTWQVTHLDMELRHQPLRDLHSLELRFEAPQLMPAAASLHLQGRDWEHWVQQGLAAWPNASESWRLDMADLDLPMLSQLWASIPALANWPAVQEGRLSLHSHGQLRDGAMRPSVFALEANDVQWPLTEQTELHITQARLAATLESEWQTSAAAAIAAAQPGMQWQVELQPSQFSAGGQTWHSEAVELAFTTSPPAATPNPITHASMPTGSVAIQWLAASAASRSLDIGALSALLQAAVVNTGDNSSVAPAHTTPPASEAAPNATAAQTAEPAPEPPLAQPNAPSLWQTAALHAAQWQQTLAHWQPSGQLQEIEIAWQAPNAAPPEFTSARTAPAPTSSLPWVPQPLLKPWPWHISARLDKITAGMAGTTAEHQPPMVAGVKNLSGKIDSTPAGGVAKLSIQDGALQLPTVFEAGPMAFERLQTELQWRLTQDGGIAVQLEVPEAVNADAAGSASIAWRSSSAAEVQALQEQTGKPAHALPGFLDLRATLTRADATAVWRYLPHGIPADVRHYVKEAIQSGSANRVDFEVRGDLEQFPFDARLRDPTTQRYPTQATATADTFEQTPPEELFRISADLQKVQFRYVPHYLLEPGTPELVWPDLHGVDAKLVFEGNRMDLAVQAAQLQAAPKVRLSSAKAWIDDLMHAQVGVDVRAAGPLADQLQVLNSTPVARMTDHVMDNLQGQGSAALRLQLAIPLESQLADQYRVSGEVKLQGNQLQWGPQVPVLSDLQGLVRFTDKGFSASNIQAQALGGPVTLNVLMADHAKDQPTEVTIDAQGTLSARGVQDYAQQAWASTTADQLLGALSGQTDYALQIKTRGSQPYVSFQSSLQGLASQLPYPLNKQANEPLPLRLTHATPDPRGREQLELTLSNRIDARYELQHATQPAPAADSAQPPQANALAGLHTPPSSASSLEVVSGQLLIGPFSADEKRLAAFIPNSFAVAPGDNKVQAIVAVEKWDVAEWLQWLPPGQDAATAAPKTASSSDGQNWSEALVPDVWYGHFDQLRWGAVTVHDAQLQAYPSPSDRSIWTTHFKAEETQGTLEYHSQYLEGTGLLRGVIDYLELPPQFGQADAQIHADAPAAAGDLSQPAQTNAVKDLAEPSALAKVQHLPTVDIEIGRLLFANRDWGKVALQAMNRMVNGEPNEWIINYLTIEVPEARLTAKGSWQDAQARSGYHYLLSGRKKMDMQFTLEMLDAGRLLSRMGMPDLLYAGNGQLNGRLSWQGSPLHLDLPSLNGDFSLDVTKGQFLKASAGAGRLLAVMSLQALPRRLTLDFRDIFSQGFAFDFVRGDVHLAAGVASTNNLQMQGVNAGVVLEGSANILQETQDITAIVVPELDAMTASLVASAINPAIGAGTFLAQFFFSKPLAAAATQEFHIQGSWSDPIVERKSKRPVESSH